MLDKKVIDIYIEFIKDLLTIDDVDVITDKKTVLERLSNGGSAKCYPVEREIYFNLYMNDDVISKLIMITHEFRHMYQWEVVHKEEFRCFEDESIVNQWEENFDSYISVGNEDYEYQPLEVDAEAFTYHIIGVLFNVSTNGFKHNNKDYMDRYLQIQNDIVEDEILDSVNFSGLINYMEELRDYSKGC